MGAAPVHDGMFIINFIVGRRRENSSVAFGKVAVGNAFSGLPPMPRYNQGRRAAKLSFLGRLKLRFRDQRDWRLWPCDRVAGFMMVKGY